LPIGTFVSIDVQFAPEPGTIGLLAPALLAVGCVRRPRRPAR
jgi:hypothetical protein